VGVFAKLRFKSNQKLILRTTLLNSIDGSLDGIIFRLIITFAKFLPDKQLTECFRRTP